MGMENYSLADIRAATRDDDCIMGGNNMWWVVLFLLFGGRGFGFGDYGLDSVAANGALTRAEMYDGFNTQNIENGIRGIQNGLCDGFYAHFMGSRRT